MHDAPLRRRIPAAQLLTGGVVAAILCALAFSGGAYDVVPRQTAALLLWWSVLIGALVLARSLRWPPLAAVVATAFGAGIAIWAGLGVDGSLSAERSAVETARGVAHLAPIVLVGWILPRRLWRSVVVGVALGGVVVCLAALGERLSPGFLEDTRTVVFLNTTQRLAAPLGYWNALGSWGVLTALLLLGLSAHAASPLARAAAALPLPAISAVIYVTYSRSALASGLLGVVLLVAFAKNRWTTVVHVVAFGVAAAAVAGSVSGHDEIADATGSAGAGAVLLVVALAGVAVAALAAATGRFGLDLVRLPRRPATIVFAVGGVLAVAGLTAGVVTKGPDAWDRFSALEVTDADNQSARLTMVNNGNRVEQWKVAWDSWGDHRWTGTGAGTFELTYNRESSDAQFVRDAHNAYLETLSEQGVIGFAMLAGFIVATLWVLALALRRAATALDRGLVAGAGAAVCAFLLGTGADWFWEVTALAMLAMTLVGALMAAATPEPVAGSARRGGRFVLPAVLVVLALAAVLVELPGLVGTSEVRRSQQAVIAGDLVEARDRADRAIDTMPWASSPFLQRALVDEQAGAYDSASRGIALAVRRDPYDWRLPLVQARIEAKRGEPEAALAAYRRAKELRPRGQFFR